MQDVNPIWYRALTLAERAATADHATSEFDTTEAQRRLGEWRLQPPFERQNIFADRLAQDGLLEETLLSLLGESPEALAGRQKETPAWLTTLLTALDDPTLWETIPWPEAATEIPNLGFLTVATPLINQARRRLRAEIDILQKQMDRLPFEPEIVESLLLPDLAQRLAPMLSRTLVLEMHIARLQGFLEGETGEARYASFVQRLQQPEVATSLWQEYPVLARQVVGGAGQWADASLDFLQHLCSDWNAIRSTFFTKTDPGVLIRVDSGAGDRHSGRSVVIATFSHGDRLVYKPHSLAVDLAFQSLLSRLNAWGAKPAFRILRVLERASHGWAEFVRGAPCATRQALHRFYKRMGGYLALLYALEGGDFHHENLIAAGEHPVLIDLEALFQPQVEDQRYFDPATAFFHNSVMRTNLLPTHDWAGGKGQGIDISGLGGAPGQLTPFEVGRWDGSGSDSMHLVRRQIALETKEHRPSLKGELVNPTDYVQALVAGFTHIYQLLVRHRDELLRPAGPLAAFVLAEVRVILRPTQQYGLLLHESYHPDLLRDALDRDRLFDKLWIGAVDTPYLRRALAVEQAALHRGDIPHFVTRPDSRDLWTDTGTCLPDFLTEAGKTQVERRLTHMGDTDLQGQLWLIGASMATLAQANESRPPTHSSLRADQEPATREQLQAMARKLGERLAAQSILAGDEAGWLGFSQEADSQLTLAPLGLDLYDGLPGIAIFLAYLGKATSDEKFSVLARATLQTIQHRLADEPKQITAIGAFNGLSGLIYTFTHLGTLWSEHVLLTQAQALATSLAGRIDEDQSFDITSGAAGCIGALLALYQVTGDPTALALAIRCGDHLQEHAQPQQVGTAWRTLGGADTPLTGFAHGTAGIAWAYQLLAAATQEARFESTAQAALAYERSLFNEEVGNWPDLRPWTRTPFMIAWCYGAAGIGLSRLSQPDTVARAEVATAVQTTLAGGLGNNHSLCHGDLGNLDFLQIAASFLQDRDLSMQVARLAGGLVADLEENGPSCGLPSPVETPGLMTGIAGIGYGLLRLSDPEQVPCLLLLAPPNLSV